MPHLPTWPGSPLFGTLAEQVRPLADWIVVDVHPGAIFTPDTCLHLWNAGHTQNECCHVHGAALRSDGRMAVNVSRGRCGSAPGTWPAGTVVEG